MYDIFPDLLVPPKQTKHRNREIEDTRKRCKIAFNTADFLRANGLEIRVTEADKAQAREIFLEAPYAVNTTPTTPGAAIYLEAMLSRYDYEVVNGANKMRNYVMFKLFELSEDPDTRISFKALETLGKVAEIGLFSTKIDINITEKPTQDLEAELHNLLKGYDISVLEGELSDVQAQLSLTREMNAPLTHLSVEGISDAELT